MTDRTQLIELVKLVQETQSRVTLYEDADFDNAQERYEDLVDAQHDLFEKAEEIAAGFSLKEKIEAPTLQAELKDIRQEANWLPVGSDEYKAKVKEIKQKTGQLDKAQAKDKLSIAQAFANIGILFGK